MIVFATGYILYLKMPGESLKHGGDTRPWVSVFRRAESVEASYEAMVQTLTDKNRLELIASVNRQLNREVMDLTH